MEPDDGDIVDDTNNEQSSVAAADASEVNNDVDSDDSN